MIPKVSAVQMPPLVLHFSPTLRSMGDREFFDLCRSNPDWQIERTATGDLVIMPPTGGETGRLNFELIGQFSAWVQANGAGVGFDSSTGFTLPNSARRSPDLAWIRRTRWDRLTREDREHFPPLCPDFVVELRSRSDPLDTLQQKMEEYLANGAELGWLIDVENHSVYVYSPLMKVQCLVEPEQIAGDPVLPGFILDLKKLWA